MAGPAFFIQGEEMYTGPTFAQALANSYQQFPLVRLAERASKGTILNAFKTIIEADISNFDACPIVGYVIDEKTLHSFTTLL
jgi:hypothetical protein